MHRNLLVPLLALLVAAAWPSRPAWAIVGGEVDTENRLSNAGTCVVVSQLGVPIEPFNFGSGSLIHPRVYLTAGHVTADAQAILATGAFELSDARISFGVDSLDPDTWLEIESLETHPAFRFTGIVTDEHDVGVMILKEPADGIEPVTLVPVGFLDHLRKSGALRGQTQLTVAGYGDDLSFPPPQGILADGLRRVAEALFTVTAKWVSIQQNPVAKEGGLNNGDSGGPAFWVNPQSGDLVQVGVTAWGTDAGVGRCVRVDLPSVREFIDAVIAELDD